MLLRDRIAERLAVSDEAGRATLPRYLKTDRTEVRVALFQRLSASRHFALGDRAGVMSSAQRRSGRSFRLDVRQRVIVKALVSRHLGAGLSKGAVLANHVAYLGRGGAGADGARPAFFDRDETGIDAAGRTAGWALDRHHFRFIISPEHGDRIRDLPAYVRAVMARVEADLGEPGLRWIATCHFDTDQPHAHVLLRGRRADGRDLVIPRDYISYGFRARAQEVAQTLLGDLSRVDAERRIWRETQADRFTRFDRRLLATVGPDGLIEDGGGRSDAWAALTRGRLRRLEGLGLAQRIGRHYRLASDLETKLRTLQLRGDVIRTLNQRRIAGARNVRVFQGDLIRGRVVLAGSHDELGASPFVVVRDKDGLEHYARLRTGSGIPATGAMLTLEGSGRAGAEIPFGPGPELSR